MKKFLYFFRSKQEFILLKKSLGYVAVLSSLFVLDVMWDWHEKISNLHFFTDILIVLGMMLIALMFITRFQKDNRSLTHLNKRLSLKSNQLELRNIDISKAKKGIALHIQQVFQEWQLTPIEKEIAMLIIKGFSFNEIAQLHHKSVRTVRDQAAVIYRKAKVKNRIELTSYFVEDLFEVKSSIQK